MKNLFLFFVCFAASALAQRSVDVTELQEALQDACQGKTLMLRGLPLDQKISYDSAFQPVSKLHPGSWALANIEVDSVAVTPDKIEISGKRAGYECDPRTLQFVRVHMKHDVQLTINGIPQGSPAEIVRKMESQIFLWEQSDISAALPEVWKEYFVSHEKRIQRLKGEPKLILRPKPEPQKDGGHDDRRSS